jgi:hypothetical protein
MSMVMMLISHNKSSFTLVIKAPIKAEINL